MTNNKIRTDGGAAMLIAVIFFLFATMTIILGVASPVLKQAAVSKNIITSKGSYYSAESSVEDILYRLKNGKQVSATESLSLNGGTVITDVTDTGNGKKLVSNGVISSLNRKVQTIVSFGTGVAFFYGVQAGQGGFDLQNSSSIVGNVYSGGPITGSGNIIYGDVVSSGPSGIIDGIHATGTAYSHTIQNSTIDKDAHYVTKTSTTVGGVSYPNSPDLPDAPLPISDAQISTWESDATTGGTATCSGGTYTISSSRSIGPIKIPCDLSISGNTTLTLNGAVWVTGNITVQNSVIIKVSPSFGNKSVMMIADNPSNRSSSSKISLQNSSSFQNSGTAGSFVLMIAMNNSGENGGGTAAIENANSAGGAVVLYAPHGLITLQNSINVKEVTAYRITLQNSAQVKYDTGLPSSLFDSGPGGGYTITDWREI
ncbi:MAG: hypothetical protein AB201_00300 [Parcubacteria bacterium C7867-006]|nr:MAG: hypothetical protein AB201_00300 [Parcubacteria bacterium C7867-006]